MCVYIYIYKNGNPTLVYGCILVLQIILLFVGDHIIVLAKRHFWQILRKVSTAICCTPGKVSCINSKSLKITVLRNFQWASEPGKWQSWGACKYPRGTHHSQRCSCSILFPNPGNRTILQGQGAQESRILTNHIHDVASGTTSSHFTLGTWEMPQFREKTCWSRLCKRTISPSKSAPAKQLATAALFSLPFFRSQSFSKSRITETTNFFSSDSCELRNCPSPRAWSWEELEESLIRHVKKRLTAEIFLYFVLLLFRLEFLSRWHARYWFAKSACLPKKKLNHPCPNREILIGSCMAPLIEPMAQHKWFSLGSNGPMP